MTVQRSPFLKEVGWEHPWRNHIAERRVVCFFTHRRKLTFFSQLQNAVRSGVGLHEGLAVMEAYAKSKSMSRAIRYARSQLDKGKDLRQAFSPHAHLLGRYYIEMLGFGEESGTLDLVLDRIVNDLEEQQSLRRKFLLSSLYLVYLLAALVFFGPLAALGPAVQEGEVANTAATMAAAYTGGLVRNLLLVFAGAGLYFGLPLFIHWLGVEVKVDHFKTQVPIVGRVYRNLYGGRFLMNLELAVSSGMGIGRALALSGATTGSPFIRSRLTDMVKYVERGSSLTDAVMRLGILPESFITTLAVSEKAGRLDEGLRTLAQEARQSAVAANKTAAFAIVGLLVLVLMIMILRRVFISFMDYYTLPERMF